MSLVRYLLFGAVLTSCGTTQDVTSRDVLPGRDASAADAVGIDATSVDASPRDSSPLDVGQLDAADQIPETGPQDVSSVDAGAPMRTDLCTGGYDRPIPVGVPTETALTEVSGIVASRMNPDVLWLHNDSGDAPRLYAINTTGEALARLELPVPGIDFEDIAAATCPDGVGECLWVADTGDNEMRRPSASVVAVREPVVDSVTPSGDVQAGRVWQFNFTYPFGPVDSEALVVEPSGQRFYLFEKIDADRATLFMHPGPLVETATATLDRVTSIRSPGIGAVRLGRMITGADLHPSGERLVLRVYTGIFEYPLTGAVESMRTVTMPTTVPITLNEGQGEAVAYARSGTELWSMSEGTNQSLHRYPCRGP